MAIRGSARSGMRRSAPVQDREHRFQVGAQVAHRLGRQRAPGLRLQLAAAAVLLDLLPRALDGVLLRVQQVLHEHDQLDLAPLVDTVAGAVLGGVQKPELTLPVAQYVRLEVGQLAHLPDGEEFLHGIRRAHRHCSALRSRSIRSAMASRGALRSNRIAATSWAMGSSTPWRSASATAARAVGTPSATDCLPACACSSVLPFPSATPRLRLRDRGPVAVRMRSPMPASPAKVSGSAPRATPSRVISASPRVISAARGLWPKPSPSRMPAARATTFFNAPPSSTPTMPGCVRTRTGPQEK